MKIAAKYRVWNHCSISTWLYLHVHMKLLQHDAKLNVFWTNQLQNNFWICLFLWISFKLLAFDEILICSILSTNIQCIFCISLYTVYILAMQTQNLICFAPFPKPALVPCALSQSCVKLCTFFTYMQTLVNKKKLEWKNAKLL